MDICKVIIPAAGIGSRFFPYTKAIPKEMLPLNEKPAIHYIIEEAVLSSIKNFILITNKDKNSINSYFDSSCRDKTNLSDKELKLLSSVEKLSTSGIFSYINQPEPLGLGHAISLAKNFINKEYFGVMLPDDIIFDKNPALLQLMRVARQEKASVIAVQEVPNDCIPLYGIIEVKKQITTNLFQVNRIIEKPSLKDAPSNLAVVGRYVLSSKIFQSLDELDNQEEEIGLSEGISSMIKNSEKVFAFKTQGIRYDIGSPLGWIKAVIGSSLLNPQYSNSISKFLKELETTDSSIYNNYKNIEHQL